MGRISRALPLRASMKAHRMTRAVACVVAAALLSPAWAADILVRTDVTNATVYRDGAHLVRQAVVTVPDGAHRLFITFPDHAAARGVRVTTSGATQQSVPQTLTKYGFAEGQLDTPEQAQARQLVKDAMRALQEALDEKAQADASIAALKAQADFLSRVTIGREGAAATPRTIRDYVQTIGAELKRVQQALHSEMASQRDLEEQIAKREHLVATAQASLRRLQPFEGSVDVLAMDIDADGSSQVTTTVTYLSPAVGWRPSYDVRLNTRNGALVVDRLIHLWTKGPGVWNDVSVSFSTADTTRRREPSILDPEPARIFKPRQEQRRSSASSRGNSVPEMAFHAASADFAQVRHTGLALTYDYRSPVSVSAAGRVTLRLDSLKLRATIERRAVPRHDETAYLIATATNRTGEPLIPGEARYFRDGALIADAALERAAPGEKIELAFGPLDHLKLEWVETDLIEGDKGVFITSNTERHSIMFSVENTSSDPQDIMLHYAVPFSQQQNLEADVTLTPKPTTRNLDDQKGVYVWKATVKPHQRFTVKMNVAFEWPDGYHIQWEP